MKIIFKSCKSVLQIVMIYGLFAVAQSCKKQNDDPVNDKTVIIQHSYDIASTCSEMFIAAKKDVLGKPFLYIASKEGGLKIYSTNANNALVSTIPIASFNTLHVMNLSQAGNYLFLALGNHFGTNTQSPGMAIIDVTDPANPQLKSFWEDISKTGGTGIVETDGNYAYLGAMGNGLFIFDITDKTQPVLTAVFIPSINYPDPNPDPQKYNARGMQIRNNLLYLCYDAGGLRILDISNKYQPIETGRYANPEMNNKPRAYNNVAIDGSLAYVAVDYCGMETLDISDPSNIKLVSWWNPWNCQTNPLNWFNSNGHCNEIILDKTEKLVFLSSGKSDLQVVSIANPANPVFKTEYGGIDNNIGTWGVSLTGKTIYLTYICSLIPFYSNWTGVKALNYELK